MSRFHFSVLGILLTALVGLCVLENVYKKSLPLINLPIEAHNTIGEVPLISQIDSGGVQNITPRHGQQNWGYIAVSIENKVKSENDLSKILTNAMDKLMVMAQQYPQISDPKVKDRTETFESLKTLRRELKDIEENIAYSRKTVNEIVRVYNQSIQIWPANIIATSSGFKEMAFFQVHDEKAKEDVKISF